jgi:hypothetical protein
VTTREMVLRARKALLNGSGKLSYFEARGIGEEAVRRAYVGYEAEVYFPEGNSSGCKGPAFTYPCVSNGSLLGVHYKSEQRSGKNKRRHKWGGYADDLPPKGHGKKPDDPAKVIPFGMETLEALEPGSRAILLGGEEDRPEQPSGRLHVGIPGGGGALGAGLRQSVR